MGMSKSYNQLKAQTKEIQRNAPPKADRMADMQACMEQVNATTAVAADPAAVIGRGQVLAGCPRCGARKPDDTRCGHHRHGPACGLVPP